MDFIEQWFGISPDGGNGTLEALYVAAIVLVVLGIFIMLRQRFPDRFSRFFSSLRKKKDRDRSDSE